MYFECVVFLYCIHIVVFVYLFSLVFLYSLFNECIYFGIFVVYFGFNECVLYFCIGKNFQCVVLFKVLLTARPMSSLDQQNV